MMPYGDPPKMIPYIEPLPFTGETGVWTQEVLFTEGRKDDQEKLRYDLIPPEALEALATILTYGAKKYKDRNWEKGMSWGRVFGALMRHSWAWWRGEKNDPESGYPHSWHALCCIVFLVTYEARKIGKDDRGT